MHPCQPSGGHVCLQGNGHPVRGSPVAGGRYLEDFAVGQTYGSGRRRVDEQRIKSFAAEFDPQPLHLNAMPILGGLAASGWHRAALTMRLLIDSDLKPAGRHCRGRVR
jgi:acyl dehydratase